MTSLKINQNKSALNLLIKVTILSLLFGAIYKKVFINNDIIKTFNTFYDNLQNISYLLLLIIFLLMICNWSMEALKWKILIHKIESLEFVRALKAIICGVTLSIFTPNRIGEYGGRIFFLQKANKIEGIAITLIGSFSQLVSNLIIGIFSLMIYLRWFIALNATLYFSILFFLMILVLLLMISYYNISLVIPIIRKLPYIKKVLRYVQHFDHYSYKELTHILLLSVLRYFIFTAQYLLLLYLFGIHVAVFEGFVLINMIFLVQTIVPTIAILEVGIRGRVALEFFGSFTVNSLGILAASFSLWLINLMIPAITGSLLILKLNFLNNKKL